MKSFVIDENKLKSILAEQSRDAIKYLIRFAESSRREKQNTNFFDSFYQEAKKHII